MKVFSDALTNFPLICAGSAWLLAQVIKVFTGIFKQRKFSIVALLWGSGGMPSSHTAAVCALCIGCGLSEGFGSVAFAVSFVLCAIVMRDATGVRRETGEQAKILNKIMEDLFKPAEEGKEKAKGEGEQNQQDRRSFHHTLPHFVFVKPERKRPATWEEPVLLWVISS